VSQDPIEFLNACAKRCRDAKAAINPCASGSLDVEAALEERANMFEFCAVKMDDLMKRLDQLARK
jgi:hypothetical protein